MVTLVSCNQDSLQNSRGPSGVGAARILRQRPHSVPGLAFYIGAWNFRSRALAAKSVCLRFGIALWAALLAAPAAATEAQVVPELSHTPVSTAQSGQSLELVADLSHPQLLKRAVLLHRGPGEANFHEVPFRRGPDHYRAALGAESVRATGLSYAIELELPSGERIPGFASRAEPFDVQVQLSKEEADEKAALMRLNGHRSVTSLSGEWVTFGKTKAAVLPAEFGAAPMSVSRDDDYYRLEASYTYRPLRTVNEFGVRLGLVRGSSPQDATLAGTDLDVGLNYAAPWLRLRLSDSVYATGHLVTGVTEVDFSLGIGAQLTLGDPYGASLGVGFETIEGFGSRFFTRVNILVSEGLVLSPIIEATDMPNAGTYGVRLLAELGFQLTPQFKLAVLGGYQARNAVSGGPSLGTTASLSF